MQTGCCATRRIFSAAGLLCSRPRLLFVSSHRSRLFVCDSQILMIRWAELFLVVAAYRLNSLRAAITLQHNMTRKTVSSSSSSAATSDSRALEVACRGLHVFNTAVFTQTGLNLVMINTILLSILDNFLVDCSLAAVRRSLHLCGSMMALICVPCL